MKNLLFILCSFLIISLFPSCSGTKFSAIKTKKLERLQLGMKKTEVIHILGNDYKISEKRMEDDKLIEVISYLNFPFTNEHYLFRFYDGSLTEWHREFVPEYELKK